MSQDDYETLHTESFTIHLLAGAMAGFMEFCVMFPIDTIKTRMQSLEFRGDRNILQYLRTMMKKEGTFSPLRGITPIAIAAGPAHGLYFANYELVKKNLTVLVNNPRYDFICHGIAGSCATLFHDSIMNPSEVVKQRMQMRGSTCKNTFRCVVDIYGNEGIRAFYRSFFTTVMMNVPFQSVHFVVYEICQNLLNPKKMYSPASHVVSGGIAGGLASAVTNPLDVCKTLLNTQEGKRTIETLSEAAKTVYNRRGIAGFFGGVYPRVMYTIPSTAICWFTYESFKFFLRNRSEHNKPKDK